MHQRMKPVFHRLQYSVFTFLIDIDRLDEASAEHRWFSHNRFNLFSFFEKDHGGANKRKNKEKPLPERIRGILHDAGLSAEGRIQLLCYPRVLGIVFNPLSVYYCHDRKDRLTAILYEVRNTFGGMHSYLIPIEDASPKISQSATKKFHVSPFNEMDLTYHFRLSQPDDFARVYIETRDRTGAVLFAIFKGERKEVSDKKLLGLFFSYPLMTLKVVMAIHVEALKLLRKGLRPRKGDPDPANAVTLIVQNEQHAA